MFSADDNEDTNSRTRTRMESTVHSLDILSDYVQDELVMHLGGIMKRKRSSRLTKSLTLAETQMFEFEREENDGDNDDEGVETRLLERLLEARREGEVEDDGDGLDDEQIASFREEFE